MRNELLAAVASSGITFAALGQQAPPAASPAASPATAEPAPTARPSVQPAQTAPTSNTVTKPLAVSALESRANEPAPLRGAGGGARGSLTAVADPEPRSFKMHDLITIVVSEQSKAKSSAKAKTDKKYDMSVDLQSFMNLDPAEWAEIITLGSADLPQFDVGGKKKFDAKGDVARQDDFTAKITGEVIEVLPNGTIVVEAYKQIVMDGETQTIRLSGRCRAEDVDATNSVQSHRLANAAIEKVTKGELKDSTEKGIIAKVLDTLFAF
jgi:flagellar L-ring protein FlgH